MLFNDIIHLLSIPMRKKTASQIICENFKIPPETIFQDYKCTYRSSVLFFGRLYIGQEHFLFIANMFGLVKKCLIRIDSISHIQESPDSSVITVVQKTNSNLNQYIFGSFKNHNAFQLMKALWKGQQIGSDVFKNQNQEQNEQYNKLHPESEGKMLIDEGQVEANFFNPQAVDSQKQKVVEITFPCSVDQFYKFFLADTATVYPRKKHLQNRQAKDIKITEWKKSDQLNSQVRQINATLKVTGVPFVKQAGMSQVWMLKRQQDKLDLNVVTQMADVPYSAYFNCEEHILVTKEGQKKCRMVVETIIVFNKATYMKGTITGRTYGDLKDQYQIWIKNVNTILDQIRKKKDSSQGGGTDVQYQASLPVSEYIPPLQKIKSIKKSAFINKLLKRQLSLQEKVDILLKLVLILIVMNFFILIRGCF